MKTPKIQMSNNTDSRQDSLQGGAMQREGMARNLPKCLMGETKQSQGVKIKTIL